MSLETETQVAAALAVAGITHTISLVGATTRDKWECDQWRVTIERAKDRRIETFDYFTGTGHRRAKGILARNPYTPRTVAAEQWNAANLRPVAPHIASVLHGFLLDASAVGQSFAEWCSDYGYSDDSIKARDIYDACQRGADKLARVIPHDVREALSTLLQDY